MLVANFGRYFRLISSRAPAHHGVDDERVLHVDEHADRRIDARQRLDREHRMEERAAGAAEALRHLDAHHAELEQLLDQLGRELRVLVHFARERADFPVRELVDAVAKNRFVFGQPRQRGHGGHGLAHEILNSSRQCVE